MLRTIKERKKFFSACYIDSFGKQQLVATMMMIINKKNEKKKVCVRVHVCIFIQK
jgi:hypothetical protein